MVDVTLIGTGALQPMPERALASAAIGVAGRVLLLDCGEGTQSAARRADVSLVKIDVIALTHYHGDHLFGLPGLLQSMGIAGRTEPVCLLGPKGLESAIAPIRQLCPYLPFELRLMEMGDAAIPLCTLNPAWPQDATVCAFETAHRVSSCGYRFDLARTGRFLPEMAQALGVPMAHWKALKRGETVMLDGVLVTPQQVMTPPRRGISVAYTGDTALCEGIVSGARDVDLMIAEGTYGEDEQAALAQEHGHMTFAQAAQAAAQAGARRLWLTHYSPMIENAQAYVQNAQRQFENARCGEDGMKMTLRFEA